MVVGLAGALIGGAAVRLLGANFVLTLAILLQTAMLLALASFDFTGSAPKSIVIGVAILSSSGVMALGFVALYSQFMGWSDPRQAGVDFTLFQCMDRLVSMVGGGSNLHCRSAGHLLADTRPHPSCLGCPLARLSHDIPARRGCS
ncbi:hypothetical protein ABIE78_004022 [Sinorhizobium fredii]